MEYEELEWTDVASSNIGAIAYDEEEEYLYVRFLGTGEYIYYGVPERVYRGMLTAPSKGRYFWRNVRGPNKARPLYSFDRLS